MNYPAPDSYTLPSKIIEGAKTAMHQRTDSIDFNKKHGFPGAGSYDTHQLSNPNHARSQKFSFGKETRERSPHLKEQKCKPGAGTYDGMADLKKTSPKFGFGTSKRPDITGPKDKTPAPGHYRVPTKIMNTANYAQVKHDSNYKNV